MSNKIGEMKNLSNDKTKSKFGGEFDLIGFMRSSVRLTKQVKRSPSSPNYLVELPYNGEWANAGSAWFGPPKRDPQGTEFFSISIRIPGRDEVRMSAFEADANDQPEGWKVGDEPVNYNIIWSPPQASFGAPSSAQSGASKTPAF